MLKKLMLAVLAMVLSCSFACAKNNRIVSKKAIHVKSKKTSSTGMNKILQVNATSDTNAKYTVIDLGMRVNPVDINNKGCVVGAIISNEPEGFIWKSGMLVKLAVDGYEKIMPRAVNDLGIIAGTGTVPGGLVKPILYENGKVTELAYRGVCSNINSLGIAIGNKNNSDSDVKGILWDKTSETDCGNLGGDTIVPRGINTDRIIVGFGDTPKEFQNAKGELYSCKRAFVYTVSGISGLGTLGGNRSYAKAINTSGKIVGASEIEVAEPLSAAHAFVWKDNVMRDLGTLGGMYSEANDINDKGQIVGNSSVTNSKIFRAVIWQDSKITDLNSFMPIGCGWKLSSANSINNNGWIVGVGYFEGKSHGYLLIPTQTITGGTN